MAGLLVAVALCAGCTTVGPQVDTVPVPEPEIKKIPIVVKPKDRDLIPVGERIVIADIEGNCAQQVKTALMKRLVDNANYDVITRDNLRQIISEADQSWAGKFNTETAAKLGRLMGASLWIVGHVAHCGQARIEDSQNEFGTEYRIIAVLQVIDIETGKVLVASASEGSYVPQPIVPLELRRSKPVRGAKAPSEDDPVKSEPDDARPDDGKTQGFESGAGLASIVTEEEAPVAPDLPAGRSRWGGLVDRIVTPLTKPQSRTTTTLRRPDGARVKAVPETEEYAVMRAADEMASGFADKFFGRPLWEEVVMWDHPLWRYSEAAALVQLGQCPLAVQLMEDVASLELQPMTEREVSQYLHNFGVALLCANEPARATEKLRSAYRIWPDPTTLSMLGLAGKIQEWSLAVEVDRQPEIEMLIERD